MQYRVANIVNVGKEPQRTNYTVNKKWIMNLHEKMKLKILGRKLVAHKEQWTKKSHFETKYIGKKYVPTRANMCDWPIIELKRVMLVNH